MGMEAKRFDIRKSRWNGNVGGLFTLMVVIDPDEMAGRGGRHFEFLSW